MARFLINVTATGGVANNFDFCQHIGVGTDLVRVHRATEYDQRFVTIKTWPGFGLAAEIDVADTKPRLL